MDIYEALVGNLLTRNGKGMVCPQFELTDDKWHANYDFLAFDFVKPELALVEVSSSANPAAIIEKAKRLGEDRVRLAKQLGRTLSADPQKARFLGFVWDPAPAYKKCEALPFKDDLCFIRIDEVVRAGSYWDGRGNGLPVRDVSGALRFA